VLLSVLGFAWNPFIVGIKSEETEIISNGGLELVGVKGDGSELEMIVNGKMWRRPSIPIILNI
jgi:hypothetical protein